MHFNFKGVNPMINDRNKHVFDVKACTRCGACFELCPELSLPNSTARQEISALISGAPTKHVLQNCTTCFSCNLYCPNDCHPYQLILENWNSLYRHRGAPPIYRFVCPSIPGNIWDMLYHLMPRKDRELVVSWMNRTPRDTVLLIGNYTHLFPDILGDSPIIRKIVPVDLLDHWEGGAYLYQGGYLDVVKKIGEKCSAEFETWAVKKVITFLDAVHHVLTEVHPNEMKISFTPQIVNFNGWLLDQFQSQELRIQAPVNLTITIHDNCYSKTNGDLYWNTARQLLQLAGCTIIEMQHHKKNSTCCGFGEGASWQKNYRLPFEILGTTKKKFQEAEATRADALVTYCSGCLYLLWAAKELFEFPIKLFHSIEIIRMAVGEDLSENERAHKERAWDIIAIISMHLFSSIFHKNFKIDEISATSPIRTNNAYFGLRCFRWLLNFNWVKKVFRIFFQKLVNKWEKKKRPLSR